MELARSHFEREINEKMIYPLSLQPVYDLMRACASSQASGVEDCGNAQLPSADEGSDLGYCRDVVMRWVKA